MNLDLQRLGHAAEVLLKALSFSFRGRFPLICFVQSRMDIRASRVRSFSGKGGEASRYRYRFGFLSRAKAFFEVRFCDTPLILAVPLASEFSSAPRISAMRSVAPAASRVFALLLER